MTARLISGLALAFAISAAGLATPAAALDDDGKAGLLDTVTGLIGIGEEKAPPDIDYRERAPLVVPPKAALPQPRPHSEKSAAWPQDPDVVARREAAAKARAPRGMNNNNVTRLSKQELLAGRVSGAERAGEQKSFGCRGDGEGCVWLHPDVIRSQGVLKDKGPPVVVGQEPSRDWLTQPPKGYRRVTQDTGQGVVQPKFRDTDEASPFYFLLKPFRKDDDE